MMFALRLYQRELASNECLCGGWKNPGEAFCTNCWRNLPVEFRQRLRGQLSPAWAVAYDDAQEYLVTAWEAVA